MITDIQFFTIQYEGYLKKTNKFLVIIYFLVYIIIIFPSLFSYIL